MKGNEIHMWSQIRWNFQTSVCYQDLELLLSASALHKRYVHINIALHQNSVKLKTQVVVSYFATFGFESYE